MFVVLENDRMSRPGNAGGRRRDDVCKPPKLYSGISETSLLLTSIHLPALRVMSTGITKLPLELLSEIIRNVPEEDLCELRSVNSTFNTLTTPAAFENIIVWNDKQVAEKFRALLHTPHIARHVQSITYEEGTLR